jgi:putative ABC transport system substrate-binding protein
MSPDRSAVADGGLASMSANFPLLYQYAAVYVDKILKGANPASLPVEQPSKFQVTVNSKTAQALGLSLSPIVLAQWTRSSSRLIVPSAVHLAASAHDRC